MEIHDIVATCNTHLVHGESPGSLTDQYSSWLLISFGGHPGFSSHVFSTGFHSISNAVEIFCTLLLPDTFKQWDPLMLFKSLLALQGVFVYPSSSQFGGPSWVLHLPRGSLLPSPSTSSLSPVCFSSFLRQFSPGT